MADVSDWRLGVDVGGTFTDFTILDCATQEIAIHKVASTPDDPSRAIAGGIAEILAKGGIDPRHLRQLGHGTTVATNMILERRGSRIGLITTRGFRDVLEIGRQGRPHLYDIHARKPAPLVPRYLRFEVDERSGPDGGVIRPLDEAAVEDVARKLGELGVEVVAICFLHSYQRPDHENAARAIVARVLPQVKICTSSDVLPEFREFERFSTTTLNAYVLPRMSAYLDRFLDAVQDLGVAAQPTTFHSNGGLMSPALVARYPVRTCLSGPAAGVVGASRLAAAVGIDNAITFDAGGTSTDVSLIVDAMPAFASDREIAGYPIRCPMIDVHVIGAGGGSIAYIDEAGGLRVGPESAGAQPGPAAYGQGGRMATVTDANVVLHRLNPESLLGGRMPIDKAAARAAVEREVAAPLGLGVEDAALGIIRVVAANMARAIRAISTERGHNAQAFALIPYGGAGPLHAAFVADEVGMNRILVPPDPGTLCARGILLSNISRDYTATVVRPIDRDGWSLLLDHWRALHAEATGWLDAERMLPAERAVETMVEARYKGQNHEIQVAYDVDPHSAEPAGFVEAFHAAHEAVHGYRLATTPIELVNLRLKAVGRVAAPVSPVVPRAGSLDAAVIAERPVYLDPAAGWQTMPVYARERLPGGQRLQGPCIVEEMTSTTVVPSGMTGQVDAYGNMLLIRKGAPQ